MSNWDADEVPDWANFLAMDPDGEWYWYEIEPVLRVSGEWEENSLKGKVMLAYIPSKAVDWKTTLEHRP